MAGSVVVSNTFATQSGNVPASELDTNFSGLASGLNALGNFGNYYVDGGSANTLAITVSTPQTVSYSSGLFLQVKVANTNTGASTINVNSLGAITIVNPNGSALVANQLISGMVALLIYNGTDFVLVNSSYIPNAFANVVKATTTARTSVSYLIDPDLQLVLAAGTYIFESMIAVYTSGNTSNGGILGNIQLGGAILGLSFSQPYYSSVQGLVMDISEGVQVGKSSVAWIGTGAADMWFFKGSFTTAGATLALYWGQETTDPNSTSVLAGSYLSATPATLG